MSDPFAHLLDSFKKNNTLKEKNKNDNDNSSNINRPVLSNTMTMEPLIPSNSSSTPNLVHSTGSNSINNTTVNKGNDYDDDWDKAFDIFNNTNINNNNTNISNETSISITDNNNNSNNTRHNDSIFLSTESSPVIDEAKDMEIAKIMSLGYSLKQSLKFYETGLDYNTLLTKQNYNNNDNDNPSKSADLLSFGPKESFTDTLTSMFNKSKKFVQSLNLTDLNGGFDRLNSYNNTSYSNYDDYSNSSFVKEDFEHLSLQNNPPSSSFNSTSASPELSFSIKDQKDTQVSDNNNNNNNNNNNILLDWDYPVNNPTSNNSFSTNNLPIKPQITDIELISYKEYKDNATQLFKNGHYSEALEQYTKSLNTLPNNHPLRLIAISNMMISQLKVGEYNNIIKLMDACEKLWPNVPDDNKNSTITTAKSNWDQIIPESEPQRTFKDIWIKIMLRCAESYEHLEDFNSALNVYKQLLNKNVTNKKVLDGKRRCEKIIYPEKFKPTSSSSSSSSSNPSVLSPMVNKTTHPIKSLPSNNKTQSSSNSKSTENVARIKQQNAKLEEESILKEKLYDQVNLKIEQWKADKPTDIRHLLSNLQQVVTWTSWTPVSSTDLVMPKKVKVTYLKAAARTHPDKVPNSLDLENKMIAENVFSTLSKAWQLFKEENNI